jgi:hypothetical protein
MGNGSMRWAVKQLLAPFRYLRIKQGHDILHSKVVFDWVFPIVLALISSSVTMFFPTKGTIFSEHGIIGGFQRLLELLIPFYIVALAAVATFERKGLDDVMKGHPAVLTLRRASGERAEHFLTRRQFICYLFGYLASCSLCLFVIILMCGLWEEKLARMAMVVFGAWITYMKVVVLLVFLIPIWQIIITTLLGVFFMSERLQVMSDAGR